MHYNLLNEFMNPACNSAPITIGTVGTMYVGSDRYPIVVTDIKSPRKVVVSMMLDEHYKALREGTITGVEISQMEFYKESAQGSFYESQVYTLRKNGRWLPQGDSMWATCSVQFGEADSYRDPCF